MKRKFIRNLLLALALLLTASVYAEKAPKQQRIYIFGVATSFTDSTAYMTEVQALDSAYIGNHGFLTYRTLYSVQLQNLMETIGKPDMTCCVIYALNEKKAIKLFDKVRKRYTKDGNTQMLVLDKATFTFRPEEYITEDEDNNTDESTTTEKKKN